MGHINQGKLYAIDAWDNDVAIQYLEKNDTQRYWWRRVSFTKVFDAFKRMLIQWDLNDVCKCIKLPSAIAVSEIEKYGEIDFLHIDGNSSQKGSLEDVENYLPLVKSGGYVFLSNAFIRANRKYTKTDAGNFILDSCRFVLSVDQGNSILYLKRY